MYKPVATPFESIHWHDAEVLNGRGTKSLYNNGVEMIPGPESKRPCPCTGCAEWDNCGKNATECSAFRNWASRGDYKDADVMRFIRAMK